MLLTVKNKQHSVLIDDNRNQLLEKIVFNNASINFNENLTFVLLLPTSVTVNAFYAGVDGEFNIAVRDGLTSNFNTYTEVYDSSADVASPNPAYQIKKWNVNLLSETEGLKEGVLAIEIVIDGESRQYAFDISCNVIGIDDKYIVLSQNFKFDITDDYYNAFKASEHKASGTDERLMNEKRKEFLLNYFDLDAEIGTYKTLLASLAFFGYGDLLQVRELWKNSFGNSFSTELTGKVMNFVDNRLSGFKKTKQLQLVYRINEEDDTLDEDGLPNYVSVLFDTEEILIKMHALKRILEKDFLPLNTTIVDIIGEHSSIVGVDSRIWLNDQRIDNVNMNIQDDASFSFDLGINKIDIHQHEVILLEKRASVDNDGLTYPDDATSTNFDLVKIFQISRVLNYDLSSGETLEDVLNDDEYVTRYYRGDFGLAIVRNITVNLDNYRRWRYEIHDVDDDVIMFESPLYTVGVNPIPEELIFGIRKVGSFKFIFFFFDHYGSVTVVNPSGALEILNGNVDFKLARIDRTGTGFDKGLDLFSTFNVTDDVPDFLTNRNPVIDCFDETLNINTFDENTHTNQVLKYYAKNFDTRSIFKNNFEFNNIPLNKLTNTRLQDYSYEYSKRIIDIHGNGAGSSRSITIGAFQNADSYEPVTIQKGNNSLDTCNRFVAAANAMPPESVWHRFTVTLDRYSVSGLADDYISVVKIVGKDCGESMSNSFALYDDIQIFNPAVIGEENFKSYTPFSAHLRIESSTFTNDGSVQPLTFTCGDRTITRQEVIESHTHLAEKIEEIIADEGLAATVLLYDDKELIIVSKLPISVESYCIRGKHMEVPRGVASSILQVAPAGSTLWLGEPFYVYPEHSAKIELWNCKWTLSDSITNEILDVQNSLVYRNVITKAGTYNLALDTIDLFGTNHRVKNGFITVE